MPLDGVYESFNPRSEKRERMVMKVEEVKVNMPELADSLFEIEILPGTRVADKRSGATLAYIAGADNVADMMLEDLAILAQNDIYVSDRHDSTRVKPSTSSAEQVSAVNVSEPAAVSTYNRQPKLKGGLPTPKDSGTIAHHTHTYILCAIVSILIVSIALIVVLKRKSVIS